MKLHVKRIGQLEFMDANLWILHTSDEAIPLDEILEPFDGRFVEIEVRSGDNGE